jgi:DNA-binding LacI/PurR family transcriptional regulator
MDRATVHDLATAAGGRLAIVDRALNRRGGVRAATIEKVELAVGRHGCRRDAAAATLARRRERRLAFVIPTRFNSFLAPLADGAPFDAEQECIPIDAYCATRRPDGETVSRRPDAENSA